MEFDRVRAKQGVRLAMKRTTPGPMLVTLAFTAVVGVGAWLINTVLGGLLTGGLGDYSDMMLRYMQAGYDVEEAMEQVGLELLSRGPGAMFGVMVGGSVLSILSGLWQSVMGVGYEGWCLSMVREEKPPLQKIFCALPQIGPVLVTRLLTGLFQVLWVLLLSVGAVALIVVAALLFHSVEALMVLMILAVYIAMIVGMIWVLLRYALVDYVLLDKGLTGLDAIRESKGLMRDRIKDAFVLQLSFFGWYLLQAGIVLAAVIIGLIMFGGSLAARLNEEALIGALLGFILLVLAAVIAVTILNLWLQPYVTGTMAKFYDWTQGRTESAGGPGGWSQPGGYNWTPGPGSSSGAGTGAGGGNGGSWPPPQPPKPKDDPWN